MKLSNKILIGFFGFIFLYLSAVFTEIRLRGNPNRFIEPAIAETLDLSEIKYLTLNDLGKVVKVVGSDKSQIEIKSVDGNQLRYLSYEILGDTLSLIRLDSAKNKPVSLLVHVPNDSFKGIKVLGAGVNVESLSQKQLSIIQNDGWIDLRDCNLGRLELISKSRANLTVTNSELDSLNALIDQSEIRFYIPINFISGEMSNNSYLRVKGTDIIQLKTDKKSRIELN
ncbi:MAG: hypothetical protein ACFHWX_09635 [Bacteroidota bacterium]